MKNLIALSVLVIAFSSFAKTELPTFELKCDETYLNETMQPVVSSIVETIKTRKITQADIDEGIASQNFLGKSYALQDFVIGDNQIVAQVFAGEPSLQITIKNGTRLFDGHNDGKFSQVGAFIKDDLLLHSISCSMERK